jgi:hypothetical protein
VKAERSRHLVLVTPPDVRQANRIWHLVDETTVVVCSDYEQAIQWAEAAPPALRAHAVTGLHRTAALMKEGRVGLLAGSRADLAALVARSALKLDTITTLVLAWPEGFADELDTLLGEAAAARRIILSWDPHSLNDFIERHARRAEIIGDIPLDSVGQPLGPVASARYAIVAASRRLAAVRDVLDTLRATHGFVWDGGAVTSPSAPPDAVIAAMLPTRDELRQLAAIGQPVVLALASQLAYLKSIATVAPLRLAGAVDRAQDRGATLRAALAERLARGDVDAELALLAPLFEDHDPALVAGAVLALTRQPAAVSAQPEAAPVSPGWVKLFVTVGRKDNAAAKDLVGAMIKEVGLDKAQIGRIDVKETFSLIEVAPQSADLAVRRLSGVSIRGRRVSARLDRG